MELGFVSEVRISGEELFDSYLFCAESVVLALAIRPTRATQKHG